MRKDVTINDKAAKSLHRLPAVDKIWQKLSLFPLLHFTKDKEILKMKKNEKDFTAKVPILDLPFMSDEEWNRLAYRNWLERKAVR